MTDTPSTGVLGRGPLFWGAMVFITTCIIIALAFMRAFDSQATMVLLLLIPIGLMLVMFKAAYRSASSSDATCLSQGEAQKRYVKRVTISTSAYLASFALLMFSQRQLGVSFEITFALALLPGLTVVGVLWAIGRLIIEETDEFLRMLVIRQVVIASGFALSLASVWGFLESADVAPHVDAYYWTVAWFVGLFIGAVANRVQHGTWGAV